MKLNLEILGRCAEIMDHEGGHDSMTIKVRDSSIRPSMPGSRM